MNEPDELIATYLDDSLDAPQCGELAAWLRADKANLRAFTDAVMFEQQLREAVQAGKLSAGAVPFVAEEISTGMAPARAKRRPLWLAGAAGVAVLGGVAAWFFPPRGGAGARQEPWLAEVTTLRGAVPVGEEAYHARQHLTPGRVALAAGAMELTLTNGVRVIFEGPGEFELLTPMLAALHSGQAVVRVPENAKGFQLVTAAAQVVDLGTEFGVKCGPGGVTDVQVFEGEVTATGTTGGAGFPYQLKAGDATRFSPARTQPAEIAYRAERFVRQLPVEKGIEIEGDGFPFNRPGIEEVAVFPATQALAVDGDFSDWSSDGMFRSERSAGRFIEGRMRYDAEFIYVAAHLGDPAPMRNVVDPATDGEFGWRGGALQIRVATDSALGWPVNANSADYYKMRRLPVDAAQVGRATNPALAHLTLWHYAPAAQTCLHVAYGMDLHGGMVNPTGFHAAARRDADGRGYTLEYAIPWKLLHAPRSPRAGETLAISWTAHWSDEGGRLWQGQHIEIGNHSEPPRIHPWERAATWGRAVFH